MTTEERPRCDCHDEPKIRRNDRASGYRCAVGHRAADKRYMRTKGGRMSRRDAQMRRAIKARAARIEFGERVLSDPVLFWAFLGKSPSSLEVKGSDVSSSDFKTSARVVDTDQKPASRGAS